VPLTFQTAYSSAIIKYLSMLSITDEVWLVFELIKNV